MTGANSAAMAHYIETKMRSVAGWLAAESAQAVMALAEVQAQAGVRGGVGEIGIHHGKLFLLLYLALQPEERAFAIDIFDDQHLNQDASGAGDKAIFLRHLASVGGDAARVAILQRDSTTVRPDEVEAAAGPIRFMSVDGGHTQAITFSDLTLAEAVLVDGGLLVLDDVYNGRWPAVAAGAFQYLAQANTQLRAFAVTPNKTFFCKGEAMVDRYRAEVLARCQSHVEGEAEIFGSNCLIVGRRNLTNLIKSTSVVRNSGGLYKTLSRVRNSLRQA